MQVFTLNQNTWFGKKGQKFIKLYNHIDDQAMCWIKKGGSLETKSNTGFGYDKICSYNEWGDIS